jgi:Fe2+ transport system protein B
LIDRGELNNMGYGEDPECTGGAIIALAGNPNTGKSTIFNALTGLNQHTGNWPGKTVLKAQGTYVFHGKKYVVVDLPGTYSLLATSAEEQVARDFLCREQFQATVVVTDATCLERNLNLVLQVIEITSRVIVCVNLIDEARRKKIFIDLEGLSAELGVPVVATAARRGAGLEELKVKIEDITFKQIITNPRRLVYDPDIEEAVALIEQNLPGPVKKRFNPRWFALRLVENNQSFLKDAAWPAWARFCLP